MKRKSSLKPILIIALIGLIAVISAAIYENYMYAQPTEGKTAQEIASMGIGPINVNTASSEELDQLPAVTPKIAEQIIAYREEHGGFETIEDILSVKGVGKKIFEQIEPYITA